MDTNKITYTAEETKRIAKKLAFLLSSGDVITLEGDLGAGKTTFTKGIAEGLGVKEMITSPTFTIIKEYTGNIPLYHMDAYRLEHSEEDMGFHEYFNGEGVSVIEWAQFIADYLPEERLNVKIDYLGENKRKITFSPQGNYFKKLVNHLTD